MQEPGFIGGDVDLRINIYRSYVDTPNGENDAKSSLNDAKNEENDAKNGENDAKNGENDAKNGLNDAKKQKELRQEERLLHVIKENPCETQAYYADQLGLSKRTISRMFVSLREKGILVQRGTSRKAHWEIIK